MSTASKVTLGASILFATGAFIFINYSQQTERAALRQGPIKDAARQLAKKQEQQEKSAKQKANELEQLQQNELKAKYLKVQPLNDEIIRGVDDEK
ncbi:PET117 [Candida pseudojiufengensis]|uniref:PET117 n=1 Tax=Candida pseudojiufengensis TaxID=497109 RepID=UPI002224FA1B|nr:PET117 [Candida pseudojiufengensis]KAI5964856.1 PET117 [Candida pseudojiufengensis]